MTYFKELSYVQHLRDGLHQPMTFRRQGTEYEGIFFRVRVTAHVPISKPMKSEIGRTRTATLRRLL